MFVNNDQAARQAPFAWDTSWIDSLWLHMNNEGELPNLSTVFARRATRKSDIGKRIDAARILWLHASESGRIQFHTEGPSLTVNRSRAETSNPSNFVEVFFFLVTFFYYSSKLF